MDATTRTQLFIGQLATSNAMLAAQVEALTNQIQELMEIVIKAGLSVPRQQP